jgi:hypothetical protein
MPKISPKIPDLEFLFRERRKTAKMGKITERKKKPWDCAAELIMGLFSLTTFCV